MNTKLIELYFQIEKELDNSSEKESKQIESCMGRLIEENKKSPPNQLRNNILNEFSNTKLMLLLKDSLSKKSAQNETEQECLRLILKILEEILGDDLIQVKTKVREMRLKKIAKAYVE
ncbi:MAG: hypothetical protein KAI72_01590 [Candidatus Pacebacteria bacterium]|nr:hypothetical protein [Candidatus Paceibacterota bacterium]